MIFDHQPNAAGDDRAIHVQLEAIEGFRGRVTPEILQPYEPCIEGGFRIL